MWISERFDVKLKEQQTVISLKANKNVEDQPIITAILELEGMKRNHTEVLKVEQTNLFICPTAFNYDSRVEGERSAPEVLL